MATPTARRNTIALASLLLLASNPAHADRRYFLQSYTPYLAPSGNLELEITTVAAIGQGDTTGTAWQNRFELEYGITDRLTGAAYLNFLQPPGPDAPMTFDGPSVELIYRLADPGRLPADPALYFETRANGSEIELEPKLLLAKRVYQLVSVVNVVGEFEHVSTADENAWAEKTLRVTAGASREIGHVIAVGVEAVYTRKFPQNGDAPSSLLLGPTLNLQTPKLQLAIGWHPQISGSPSTNGGLDLADFARSEFRMILGVEL